MAESIYGKHKEVLPAVLKHLVSQIENYNETKRKETGEPAYEHLIYRIKSEDSMREKCQRKGLPCRSLRSMISMTQSASASSAAF